MALLSSDDFEIVLLNTPMGGIRYAKAMLEMNFCILKKHRIFYVRPSDFTVQGQSMAVLILMRFNRPLLNLKCYNTYHIPLEFGETKWQPAGF